MPLPSLLPLCRLTLLATALACAGAVGAAPQLELTARQSSLSLGGITSAVGIAGVIIDPGSVTSSALTPNELRLQGETPFLRNENFLFYAELQARWNIGQRYDIGQDGADTRLRASSDFLLETQGSAGFVDDDNRGVVCGLPCVTDYDHPYTSSNTLSLVFSLSEATSFAASGRSAKGQVTRLQHSTDGGTTWAPYSGWNEFLTYGGSPLIGAQATTVWDQSGTLAAGLYSVSNSPDGYGNVTYSFYEWSLDLRLANTTLLSPVPEPGAGWMAFLGLAGVAGSLALRRRLKGR
jgi:MYXO-CTERM domain-containing protein